MAGIVSGRLPDDLLRDLDRWGRSTGRTRSEVLRDVVRRGLAAERLERAVEAYRRREASLGKAADLAGVPPTVFLDALRQAGVVLPYDKEEAERDLDWAAKQ
jgi:predicted HTH domain antitoxin